MGDSYQIYARRDDIPYSQVQFEELGRGRSGTVTKVQRKSPPHEIYAMKSIDVRANKIKDPRGNSDRQTHSTYSRSTNY